MYFLLFVIVLVIFLGLFVILRVWGIIRSVFRPWRKNSDSSTPSQQKSSKPKEKFFKSDQGEYVDYEEIKEEK